MTKTTASASAEPGLDQQEPLNPYKQKIAEIRAAIEALRTSPDPTFLLHPHKREEMMDGLQGRIAEIQAAEAAAEKAAAEKAAELAREERWRVLAPQREAWVKRWNKARSEAAAVYREGLQLDRQHLEETHRKMLSEPISSITFVRARAEAHERTVLFRKEEF